MMLGIKRSAGGIRVGNRHKLGPNRPRGPRTRPGPASESLLDSPGEVSELGVVVQECEVDLADGTIAMLGDDDLGDPLLS